MLFRDLSGGLRFQVYRLSEGASKMGRLKFISWNLNGIRSVLKKGFLQFVEREDPDFLCLQEVKAGSEEAELELSRYRTWNPARRKGYSGTALFSKAKPLGVTLGMDGPGADEGGRVITAEFPDFFLVNVYTPNSKRDLSRLPYRRQWDKLFLAHLKNLEKKKPVIFSGDLNVAHEEIDLTNPKANTHNHGFTPEERSGFGRILKSGFLDTFRELHKEGGHYTWWSPMGNCRARNIGWRIDYFCISRSLRPRLEAASILPEVTGSDHCPVSMELDD